MKHFYLKDMVASVGLTQDGQLSKAAAALQRMFGGQLMPAIDDMVARARSLDPAPAPQPLGCQQSPASGARFLAKTFSNQHGSRSYKLYVPGCYHGQPAPLIVMLHGCIQSADDFAAGTQMNIAAEAQGCLVAYPAQTSQANAQRCWNWFNHDDQQRDAGEPALIAGITRTIMHDFAVDPARVYVAGLSAGGAAAAIMGNAYPDLFTAVGVHSGLACGAARDMQSAFAAMQRGSPGAGRSAARRDVPTIVFHGTRDTTVNPRNGEAVVEQAASSRSLRRQIETGEVPGGHAYTRTLYLDAADRPIIEKWVVQGAGHAWFGGSSTGSYTDPKGPDATGEMMRFFLQQRK